MLISQYCLYWALCCRAEARLTRLLLQLLRLGPFALLRKGLTLRPLMTSVHAFTLQLVQLFPQAVTFLCDCAEVPLQRPDPLLLLCYRI